MVVKNSKKARGSLDFTEKQYKGVSEVTDQDFVIGLPKFKIPGTTCQLRVYSFIYLFINQTNYKA